MRYFILILLIACQPQLAQQSGIYAIHFCPQDCEQPLTTILKNSPDNRCAFYDLNTITPLINQQNLLIFQDNFKGIGKKIPATHGGLMHNKFCLLKSNIIMTGSMNPTKNGMTKNANILFFIQGKALFENYENEYYYLQGKQKQTPNPLINHATNNQSFLIENYFCPRDNCEEHVLKTIKKANHTIRFMLFSFTSDAIGQALIQQHRRGIHVTGILEPSQFNKYSEEKTLQKANISFIIDQRNGKLHHKTFIIDNTTVIIGSYNPTRNGNERNNENILIIHDAKITKQFIDEYERLANSAS